MEATRRTNVQEEDDEESDGPAVIKDAGRESVVPSNILEKGMIYFFFRGRVGINEPHGTQDIARSYNVHRPFPVEAKIGGGSMESAARTGYLLRQRRFCRRVVGIALYESSSLDVSV